MLTASSGHNYAVIAALITLFLLSPVGGNTARADSAPSRDEPPAANASPSIVEQIRTAARSHHSAELLSLLKQRPEIADAVLPDGRSLLGLLAYRGEVEAVKELLRRGADPNLGDTRPLSSALLGISDDSRSAYYNIIVALLNAGANYEFYYVNDASFVEGLIMEVCDPAHFSVDLLDIFHGENIRFTVDKRYLANMGKIEELSRLLLTNPSCFSFFSQRVTKTNNS